jgi:site-specific DNA-methyltransferase (adenine-specific)
VKQNDIAWIKVDTVDGVLSGHFKPVTSKRYLDRAHELILHLTKFGDVVLDRLAVGVPFADRSNIKRQKHSQDRRCGTNVWFIPYKTVQ